MIIDCQFDGAAFAQKAQGADMELKQSNAFCELMELRGKAFPGSDEIESPGCDPFYATPFKIAETSAAVLAARAVAANDLWELRTGRRQRISVSVSAAAAASLAGTDQTRQRGKDGFYHPIPATPELCHMVSLTQPWQTRDGKWFLPHFNLPHLEKKVLGILNCEGTPAAVQKAVGRRDALELDSTIAASNATGGIVFTPEEWLKHPHGKHLAALPVVKLEKVAESDPEPFRGSRPDQPLSGVRVLELCRILAGPTCGLSLAEHGADVLAVTAPSLPQVPPFVRDVNHSKRSCFLDYTKQEEAKKLMNLVRETDIFLEGYRPGAMERHGFGVNDLIRQRPGLIYVSVDCFGPDGCYSDRAGWDQVAQAVTGLAYTQGKAEGLSYPKLTPVYCCDFLTGFLGAYGAMLALARRSVEGGSWHVHVSLCQTAMLLQREGLVDDFADAPGKLSEDEFSEYAVFDDNTVYGDLQTLGPVIRMSETNPAWFGTTPALGSSEAAFLK